MASRAKALWRALRKRLGYRSDEDEKHKTVSEQALIVRVIRGIDLKNMELCGKQDPYCVVSLGEVEARTAVVSKGGENPQWTEEGGTVEVGYDPAAELLHIRLFDSDKYAEDDFIGEVCIRTHVLVNEYLAKGQELQKQLQVYRRGTKPKGKLEVRLRKRGIVQDKPTQPSWKLLEATPVKIHKNEMTGAVHAIQEGDALAFFLTYHVGLHEISEIFQETWNEGKNGMHPETFQDNARGQVIRGALSGLHKSLYMDVYNGPSMFRTTSQFLCSASDFLNLIHGGVRDKRRRVYTYSLVDDGMFFSETGVALTKDNASKHAIHADGAMKVRYAGTFRVCKKKDGQAVLVIDNDSGTYKPKAEHQNLLSALLERNLFGLEVLTLNVVDEQPPHTLQWVGPNEKKSSEDAVYAGKWDWLAED